MTDLPVGDQVYLSTVPAGTRARRLALAVVLPSLAIFLILVPYATTPLRPIWAFIPCYESALVISDLITAALLLGQFNATRSGALLALGNGYLFTALMTIVHALTFPGLFAPGGLLGAGAQSTAWMYMLWHGGFPLFVIGYSLLRNREARRVRRARHSPAGLIVASAAATAALVGVLAVTAIGGQGVLPSVISNNHYTPTMIFVAGSVWSLSVIAMLAVGRKRPYSILDLWLMIVLCAWLIDIGLSALLNNARFDLGFYAGRVYGLLAANFVLLVLLAENSALYRDLVKMADELRHMTALDALTGIANRRAFDLALEREWRCALRNAAPLSLLMIDIDYFKHFNDGYGHVQGDQCLRAVAKLLAESVRRAGDLAARYGGEEFAILLPCTEAGDAQQLGQRICHALAQLALPHEHSQAAGHVTVSIGVACHVPAPASQGQAAAPFAGLSAALLVESADQALYARKSLGRNGVSLGRLGAAPGAPRAAAATA